jgi:hypothetical protein
MLIQRQLMENARAITKESLELRHDCRNTRSISRLLRDLLQEERKSGQLKMLGILLHPNNPPKGTA